MLDPRKTLALVVLGLFAVAPVATGQQAGPADGGRLALLRSWVAAVERHTPGEVDSWLTASTGWSGSDLARLRSHLDALFIVVANPRVRRVMLVPTTRERLGHALTGPLPADSIFEDAALEGLRTLARDVRARGVNEFIKRAVLFHTDVITLGVEIEQPADAAPSSGATPYRIQIADGRLLGVSFGPAHWEIGRQLVRKITPNPAADDWAREWYRATAAFLQRDRHHMIDHVLEGLRMYPSDAHLLFLAACHHETMASPAVQAFVQSAVALRVRPAVESDDRELSTAERLFAQAVGRDPAFAEARIRLARVQTLRGRHREAAEHLRAVLETRLEPLLEYYANLFLGTALAAGQDREGARDAYTRAAALFPRSQSAHLALADLAWRLGERAQMLEHLPPALADSRDETDDPWRDYHVAQGRRADDMLNRLREPFLRAPP